MSDGTTSPGLYGPTERGRFQGVACERGESAPRPWWPACQSRACPSCTPAGAPVAGEWCEPTADRRERRCGPGDREPHHPGPDGADGAPGRSGVGGRQARQTSIALIDIDYPAAQNGVVGDVAAGDSLLPPTGTPSLPVQPHATPLSFRAAKGSKPSVLPRSLRERLRLRGVRR